VKGQHTGERLAVHLKNVLDHFELTDGRLLRITADTASSNYSMTHELQSTPEVSAIQWPALRNHIPCMPFIIQLALGAFMSSLGVNCRTKSWEAHEYDQQFGENDIIDIENSQRLRKEGNSRMNKVSAMKPALAKIVEKVRTSWYFASPENDLHIADNACCNDYADTWLSKRVHWLTNGQSSHGCTNDYGCEESMEPNTGVAGVSQPITGIHMRVAPTSKIHWVPATFHNSRWVDHCEVCHGSIEAISILDPVHVKEAYIHIASRCASVQGHVRSHGWHDVSLGQEDDYMEGRVVVCCEVSSTEAVQILRWSDSYDGQAARVCT